MPLYPSTHLSISKPQVNFPDCQLKPKSRHWPESSEGRSHYSTPTHRLVTVPALPVVMISVRSEGTFCESAG